MLPPANRSDPKLDGIVAIKILSSLNREEEIFIIYSTEYIFCNVQPSVRSWLYFYYMKEHMFLAHIDTHLILRDI